MLDDIIRDTNLGWDEKAEECLYQFSHLSRNDTDRRELLAAAQVYATLYVGRQLWSDTTGLNLAEVSERERKDRT